MPAALPTLAEIDDRLEHARIAYYRAIDDGKLDMADLAYAQIDRLLEMRQAYSPHAA
jgi:hypothetical protein